MPGLQGTAQGEFNAVGSNRANQRKAKLEMRRKPGGIKGIARIAQLGQHIAEIGLDECRQ